MGTKGGGRANRAVLPPSRPPFLAGSAGATARRTAAPPPLSAAANRRDSGGGAASPALCSTSFIMSISILVARRSADADLSTIWLTIASRLVSLRRSPSIVTTTVSFSASANSAGRLLALRPRQRLTFEAPEGPFYIGVRGDNPNAADIRSRA